MSNNVRSPKQVTWLYYDDFAKHPFIKIAVDTLANAGSVTLVLDRPRINLVAAKNAWERFLLRLKAHFRFLAVFYRTWRFKPEIIIITMPQFALVGWLAARIRRSLLVYYPFELFGEQHAKVSRFIKIFEKIFLRFSRVDVIITQNEERAKIYTRERWAQVQPVIIHNYKPWRPIQRTGRLRKQLQLSAHETIVLYEGLLLHGRWLEQLISAVQYLPKEVKLVFMGEQMKWWKEQAAPLTKDPKLEGRILVAPWVPADLVPEYIADADAGIIIYDNKVRNNIYCEPGKLSDYIMAGVPVIAPNFPTVGPIIKKYNIGAVFDHPEPQEIARAIQEVLALSHEQWQEPLKAAGQHLRWETQAPVFLRSLGIN